MTNYWGLFFIIFVPWIVGMGIGYCYGSEKQAKEKKPAVRWYEQ